MKIQTEVTNPVVQVTKNLGAAVDSTGIIAVYNTHDEAERAVKEMQRCGFNMKKLSIVGRDFQTEENIVGYYNIGDRTAYWGKQGAFWGGMWGLLFGSALFIISGFGPLVIAGTFVATVVAGLEGAVVVGGISALGAALFSIGIPKNSVVEYETDVKAGKYVMIVHGNAQDLEKARETILHTGARRMDDFNSENLLNDVETIKH